MKSSSISRQLALLVASSIVIILVTVSVAYTSLRHEQSAAAQLTRETVTALDQGYDLLSSLTANQSTLQHLLRQKDPDEIEKGLALIASTRGQASNVIATCGGDATEIVEPFRKFVASQDAAIEHLLLGNNGLAFEQVISTVNPEYERVLRATKDRQTRVSKNTAELLALHETKAKSEITLATTILCGLGIILAIAGWRVRHRINLNLELIVSRLSTTSEVVLGSATQVASASHSLAEGSSEQAASLEETGASMEEMSSMIQRNAANAQAAERKAREAREAADAGTLELKAMNGAIQDIKTSSDDVSKIIKAIDEIAFQTNLLALNAAVEAARAGEAGMGFAVVADEVRSLAHRSAQAAKETTSKIESAIQKTAQGVQINERVSANLGQIAARIREVDQLVAEVATATSEQSQGINQINIAIGQMDRVTQTTAATAEESASAAQELNAQSVALQKLVVDLRQLSGATLRSTPAESKAHGQPTPNSTPGKPGLSTAGPRSKTSAAPHPTETLNLHAKSLTQVGRDS